MKKILMALSVLLLILYSCEKEQIIEHVAGDTEFVSNSPDEVIPGQYIVILEGGVTTLKSAYKDASARKEVVTEEAMEVFSRSGIPGRELKRVYGTAIKGFAVSMSKEEAALLEARPEVKGVWEDQIITLGKGRPQPSDPPPQTIPYGITRVGGGAKYTGEYVAWIIDTGIDLDHPDLNVDVERSETFVVRTTTGDDDHGHGTHCAGIVAAKDNDIGVVGVAAGATVVAVKVLNRRGAGTITGIIAGVDYVAANAVAGDAVNMSLGGGVYEPLDVAVFNLTQDEDGNSTNIYVALAAGNEADDANNHSPARVNGGNIYTVSAMWEGDQWASFSNFGNPPIDYCAPGVYIFSTYKNGGYATMSGTSMAAPHVCGLLLATGGNIATDGYVDGDPDVAFGGIADPIAHLIGE